MTDTVLCTLSDLSENTPIEVTFEADSETHYLFAVLIDKQVHVWKNSCPHQGRPMNWAANQFLVDKKKQLVCAAHGACFNMQSGLCTSGPCSGESLIAYDVYIQSDYVYLKK